MRLQSIRLLTEYRLVVSAEIDRDSLVRNLAMLAEAGFQGMAVETLRFEIDGESIGEVETAESPDPTPLRPPTDPRVEAAARQLRKVSRELDVALGWRAESPKLDESEDRGTG